MPIKKKFIGLNQIDGERILLDNAESLRAKSSSGNAEELMKLDSSDVLQFLKLPRVAVDPSDSNDLARKSYVDSQIEGAETGIQSQIDAHETRIATAEGEIDTLQSEVDALETSVGVLNGNSSVTGSVDYKVAQSVNSILNGAPEAFDTLKEIADYISSDQSAASQMTAQLNDHENRLDTLEGDSSVVGSVDKKVADEAQLRQAADANLQSQITQEVSDREAAITTLSGQVQTLASGLVQDQIADGETAKAPSQNAVFDALALKASQADLDNLDGYAQDIRDDHDALDLRVAAAESDIDALESSVALKASQADLSVLAGRVTTAESDIDALESAVAQKIPLSQKGAAMGVATLGSDQKIPASQIPALALVETYVVASEAEMLALSAAEQGDVAVRTDLSKSFVLSQNGTFSEVSSWIELLSPTYDPSGIQGQLDGLDSRLDQAEFDIDAVEASVATKAPQSELDALEARVDTAEADIDAVEQSVVTEAAARQSGDAQTLVDAKAYTDTEIDALPIERMTYESKVLGAQDISNAYIDVQHSIQAQPMIQVNRVWLAPTDDFSVSGARIDFSVLQGTAEALEAGDKLHIWYCRQNSSTGGGSGGGGGGGGVSGPAVMTGLAATLPLNSETLVAHVTNLGADYQIRLYDSAVNTFPSASGSLRFEASTGNIYVTISDAQYASQVVIINVFAWGDYLNHYVTVEGSGG